MRRDFEITGPREQKRNRKKCDIDADCCHQSADELTDLMKKTKEFRILALREQNGQARLGNALVSRTHDMYSARQIQEQIAQQVTDAVYQLEEAKQALEAGNISFDLAQKSLASDQRKFELGAETNFFVLDSQTKLAAAELTLLQTQVNYQVALAAVGHATASLLGPYQLKIAELSK